MLTYDINEELHNSFSKDVTKEQIEAGGGEVRTKLLFIIIIPMLSVYCLLTMTFLSLK